jgi:hypothetical protein
VTYPDVKEASVAGIFTAEGPDADKVRDRLAAIGMEWYHRCQSDRTAQERQWYLNLAFYLGNQNVQFRQTVGTQQFDLYTPRAPYYRVRLVVNQVRKIVRKEISRLTAQKPNAFVVPSSSEDQDVFAAQAGEQIWDSLWRELKLNKILRDTVFWQVVCGNGFIKSYWDPSAKDPDTDVYGAIKINSVSPFHVFVPDLMCTDIEDQPYIIHAQIRSNSWVKQVFGLDSAGGALDEVDQSLQTVMNVNRNGNKKDQTTILEIWVKPGYLPELPEGGMFTIANNKVVQGFDSWPYEHNQYPISKLDAALTGKFYNSSIIEDLIPLQRELNRSRSQLIEAKNRASKPQLVAPKGSVDPKKITTEPGQVIEYNVGMDPPQPLPLQNIPSYVTEEINRLYDDMADISGQHDVSNGSTPPGVTAATAISFLQEQDESIIAASYSSIEEAVEKIAYQSLTYVKMYWDEPRTVKIVGIEGTFDVQIFKGSDLKGNSDIRIEAGSALPTSRAAKQAFIMDLMKMGFIPPDEGLEILEIGGINRIYERIQVDKRQAQRENLKMRSATLDTIQQHMYEWTQQQTETGKVDPETGLTLEPPLIVPVNTWDNHEIHISMHNNYRKSQNFDSAPPEVKALFEEHVKQHMEASMGAFTGQLPMDPNSLPTEGEDGQPGGGQGSNTNSGPEPMPQLEGDQPQP